MIFMLWNVRRLSFLAEGCPWLPGHSCGGKSCVETAIWFGNVAGISIGLKDLALKRLQNTLGLQSFLVNQNLTQ